jgi:hypothetical protein
MRIGMLCALVLTIIHHVFRTFLRHIDRLQVELDRARSIHTIKTEFTWVQRSFSSSISNYPLSRGRFSWTGNLFNLHRSLHLWISSRSSALQLDSSATGFQRQYANVLHQSITAYQQLPIVSAGCDRAEYERRFAGPQIIDAGHRILSRPYFRERYAVLQRSGLWPCITPRNLLDMLTLSRRDSLKGQWKEAIVEYAKAITMVQRAKRISKLGQKECEAERERELTNTGRIGWDPMENVDWLLVELESNLLVRSIQAKIAAEMLRPAAGRNSVMQLNMGEGKSSVGSLSPA